MDTTVNLSAQERPRDVLLVEDNEHDVELTRRGIARCQLPVNFHHVDNGAACMRFLRKEAPYTDAPTPDLILLDLNMPQMNGRQVLQAMADDPQLRNLRVAVLTTSADECDMLDMFKLQCCFYIVKPIDFAQFGRLLRGADENWLSFSATAPRFPWRPLRGTKSLR